MVQLNFFERVFYNLIFSIVLYILDVSSFLLLKSTSIIGLTGNNNYLPYETYFNNK